MSAQSICLSCKERQINASPHYVHAYSEQELSSCQCYPAEAPGFRRCWNCKVSEKEANSSLRHDFIGHGVYTCEKPYLPKVCLRCQELEQNASEHYKHAYTAKNLHEATCLGPALPPNRICWVCGVPEAKCYDEERKKEVHDFSGKDYARRTCHPLCPIGVLLCENCETPVNVPNDHERDDSMNNASWSCSKAKGIFQR